MPPARRPLLALCYGTRPQIIKAAALVGPLSADWELVTVDTGQHYDYEMNALFYEQLGVRPPDVYLEAGPGSHAEQTAAILVRAAEVLAARRPWAAVVIGDTNSTLGCALAAAKLRIPVVHVEAGMRASDVAMAEEVNRRAVDAVSAVLCAPSAAAAERLRRERPDAIVAQTGDVGRDVLLRNLERAPAAACVLPALADGPFVFATLHRAELTDDPDLLAGVVRALGEFEIPVAFPVHPRTRRTLALGGAAAPLPPSVHLLPPLGYVDALACVRDARAVVTDSGGVQREAYWVGTPCVTVRAETEWGETVACGANVLVPPERAAELPAAVAPHLRGRDAARAWNADAYGRGDAALRTRDAVRQLAARLLPVCALAVLAACGAGDPGADAMASAPGAPAAGGWPTNGGDVANTRFTTLSDLTPANVGRLQVVRSHEAVSSWRERLVGYRDGPGAWSEPGSWRVHPLEWRRNEPQVSTPVVDGGTIFYTGAYNVVVAVDAASGRELWRYQHRLRAAPMLCCGPHNRGVGVDSARAFAATLDAQLLAFDRRTGAVRWRTPIADPKAGYSVTMAPLVVDGMVVVGVSGAGFGIRGFVDAYDAATGARRWRFWTIPSPEQGGWWGRWTPTSPDGDQLPRDIARERADSARYADTWKHGGGSVWMTPAHDPRLGLLYFGVGNPGPALNGTTRPGDNLYTASVVAVDARTGAYRWHYQMVPHDLWDTDAASPPVLFDAPGPTGPVPAIAQASKNGWVYILDRRTGARLRRSEPFVPQHNLFVPPDTLGRLQYPAIYGGSRATLPAYSPRTGLLYVMGAHVPVRLRRRDTSVPGLDFFGGTLTAVEDPPPPHPRASGSVVAIDVATGKIRWRVATVRPARSSGMLATATGLLFYGDGPFLRAVDAASGRALWSLDAGADVNGPPVTFALGGRQRVAVVTQRGLLVLALPGA